MASEKKAILVFTPCGGGDIKAAGTPALAKMLQKGVLFTAMSAEGDVKTLAGAGAPTGETLWDAAQAAGLTVAGLDEGFDLCVLDAGPSAAEVENAVSSAMEAADRATLIVVVAADALVFYGPGIAKGKVVDRPVSASVVAPTVAYVINFPVPSGCEGAVAYAALKDVNLKLNEIKKLNDTINNMEAAIERKSRQPWDKHDCA